MSDRLSRFAGDWHVMKSLKPVAASLAVIVLGVAWLLNTMHVITGVNWVWTLGLAMAGLLVLALNGLNRLTIVTGPFLLIASVFSVMRQAGRMSLDREIPSLVIALGVLMLLAQLLALPNPKGR
jgi:hypothetical protein